MKRILAVLAVLGVLVSGNAWAQENQQVDQEFYKQVPKNAHLHGELQTLITTDLDLRDSRLKAGHAAVSQEYEEFSLVLEHATLGNDGKVLIEDGALAYGLVLWSKSYTEGSEQFSELILRLTYVQKRDGSLGRVYTKDLVFTEKRPSRKSVWLKSLGRASIYSLFATPAGGAWYIFAGGYGFGSGKGEYGHERKVYQPKDIILFDGQKLHFKVLQKPPFKVLKVKK